MLSVKEYTYNFYLSFYCFTLAITCEIYVNYVDVFGLAPSNYFFLLSALLLNPLALLELRKNKFLLGFLITLALSCVVFLISDVLNNRETNWMYLFKTMTKFPLAFVMTAYFTQKFGAQKIFQTFLWICVPNLLISIFQFLGFDIFWDLRKYLEPTSYTELINKDRPSGLSYYAIEFAHQTLVAFFAAIALLITQKKKNYLYLGILAALALCVSQTRSHIIALYILLLILPFFAKVNKSQLLTLGVALSLFIAAKPEITRLIGRVQTQETNRILKDDTSFYSRIYLVYGAYLVFRERPFFGLGSDIGRYNQIVSKMKIPDFPGIAGKENVAIHFPHNAFINYLVTYGLLGLIILLLFLLYLSQNLFIIGTPEVRVLLTSLLAFLFTALFHNGATWNTSAGIVLMAMCCGVLGIPKDKLAK